MRGEGCLSSLSTLPCPHPPWYGIEEERQGQTILHRKSPLAGSLLLIESVVLGGDSLLALGVPWGPLRELAAPLGWLPASSHVNTSLPDASVALRKPVPHDLIYSRPDNTSGIQFPYFPEPELDCTAVMHCPPLYSLPSLPRAPVPSLGVGGHPLGCGY